MVNLVITANSKKKQQKWSTKFYVNEQLDFLLIYLRIARRMNPCLKQEKSQRFYISTYIEADRKTYKQAAEKRIRETQKGVLSRTAMGWVFWIKTFWRLLTLCFLIACT
uniref:Calcium-dependent protein kinase 1 n=1 Tax=Rhizophora mucronata TaxID=61149 RepID=A0A2P2JIL1_RHIMU